MPTTLPHVVAGDQFISEGLEGNFRRWRVDRDGNLERISEDGTEIVAVAEAKAAKEDKGWLLALNVIRSYVIRRCRRRQRTFDRSEVFDLLDALMANRQWDTGTAPEVMVEKVDKAIEEASRS